MQVSVHEAVKSMRHEFRDLTNKEFNTGVARAINHTMAKTKTASGREIRSIYNMTARDVNKALTIRRANRVELTSMVIATGKPTPLRSFKPVQTKEGVTVQIKKGARTLVRGAFMASMGNGHTGVYARGTYKGGGGDFQFRNRRIRKAGGYTIVNGKYQPINNDLNINELTTVSVPRAMAHKAVLENLSKNIEQEFPKRLMHELMRIR